MLFTALHLSKSHSVVTFHIKIFETRVYSLQTKLIHCVSLYDTHEVQIQHAQCIQLCIG